MIIINFCLIPKHPDIKTDLSKICTCFDCAGLPVYGRFRCVIDPNETFDDLGYIMSPWEKDQVARFKKQKIFFSNIQDPDCLSRGTT